jgi:hypothetical protein
MQRPTQSPCSPPHHSQPPSTVLPHARAPPPAHHQLPAAGSTDHGLQHRYGGSEQMKRRMAIVALVFVAFALIAQQALAVSPHFVSASARLSGTNLVVSFKEAGLGTNQLINYTASADATVTYVCVNRGGGNPSASNKTTITGPVSASGTFSSGKNGNVTASLTLNPPGPGSFSCPPGQSLEIAQVVYTNVAITDTTNGVTEPIPGTFDTGCLLPNVRGAC